jgi:MoxR-like ATPase
VLAVTLTEDTPAAELRGHWVPAGGDFRWQDGPTIAAWRGGHRLGLDEIDRASGAALTWLMGILDDFPTAMLTLPSGETLRPHSRFSVVATMNGDPAVDLRPALRDRFPVAIHVDAIHPAALAQLPDDLRAVAMTTTFAAEPDRQASVRRWQEFARLREHLGEEMAARACFDPRAEELLTALRVARG